MPPIGPPAPPPGSGPPAWLVSLPQPSFFNVPARNLTQEQARDILLYLMGQSRLMLDPVPAQTKGGIHPRPGDRIKINPNIIDGVLYSSGSKAPAYIDNLDSRMAVVLYRLAKLLNNQFLAVEIKHMGIGHGRGGSGDCHNTGRALDFAGIVNLTDSYTVLSNWGSRPIPSLKPIPGHKPSSFWPESETKPTYRLRAGDGVPFVLFRAVYEFATRECQDLSQDPDSGPTAPTPSQIGQRSFVCHPDHPSAKLRAAHQNHIHMQIGHTFPSKK